MRSKLVVCLLVTAACLLILSGCQTKGTVPLPCDPNELYTPTLFHPLANVDVIKPLIFNWGYLDSSCTPEEYEFEMSDDAILSNIIDSMTTTDSNYSGAPALDVDTWHYWRVRAVVEGVQGPWSALGMFKLLRVCTATEMLELIPISPLDDTLVYRSDVTFIFDHQDADCYPGWYHLLVSKDPSVSSLIVDTTAAVSLYNPSFRLTPCHEYYWTVAGSDQGEDGPFTSPIQFRVHPLEVCPPLPCGPEELRPPHNYQPGNTVLVDTLTPTLTWDTNMICEPDGYVLHLTDRYPHLDPDIDLTIDTTAMTWTPSVPLQPSTYYYWQVAARTGSYIAPFGYVSMFRTGPECTYDDSLAPPILLSPDEGALIENSAVTVFFESPSAVCLPEKYQITLSTSPDPSNPLLEMVKETTYRAEIFRDLYDCTRYYWWVRAQQGFVDGPLSEVRSFFVDYSAECVAEFAEPEIEALQDLACRFGPGSEYEILGYFLAGESSTVYARDTLSRFWVIENLDSPGTNCWVPQTGTQFLGDLEDIRIFNPPALPAAPPSDGGGGVVCTEDLDTEPCKAADGIPQPNALIICVCP